MDHLDRLEADVLQLHGKLALRPTLETAARIGEKLLQAKPLVTHGAWIPWLKRCGLSRQSASDYMAVATHIENVRPAGHLTIKSFLQYVRSARASAARRERERVRAELAAASGTAPGVILRNTDCTRFRWPRDLDCVATDPPWSEMAHYKWLAGMCSEHLRPGGLALIQCGTSHLPEVLALLTGAGLSYVWTLAIQYSQVSQAKATTRFRAAWRPVIVCSRGTPATQVRHPDTVSDGYTVRTEPQVLHHWQQPLEPWRYWLGRLVPPGGLVADPFAGSATVGVACRMLNLRYIGTEIDRETFRVARGRLTTT
jgi:site-specific DNA-methyltransferase (adenine-specific)